MVPSAEEALAFVSPPLADTDAYAPAAATKHAARPIRALAAATSKAAALCKHAAAKAARGLSSTFHLRQAARLPPAYLLCPDANIGAAEALWLVNPHMDLPASPLSPATCSPDTGSAPTVPAPAMPITPEQPALIPSPPPSLPCPAQRPAAPATGLGRPSAGCQPRLTALPSSAAWRHVSSDQVGAARHMRQLCSALNTPAEHT